MRKGILFASTVVCLLIACSAFAATKPIICDNTYALCSAAACQPIPGMPGKVMCSCSIWKGKNIGYSTCQQRKKRQVEGDYTALVSTFSFGGGHYKYMTCPATTAWASCLDQPCLIDKQAPDGRRAFCTCNLVKQQAFVTFAGECQPKNCDKAIWSGASISGNNQLTGKLAEEIGMSDIGSSQCPIE